MVSLSIPQYVNYQNFKRCLKVLPYYITDGSVVHQELLEKKIYGIKGADGKFIKGTGCGFKNFGSTFKESLLGVENSYKGIVAKDGGFFKHAGKVFKQLPSEVSTGWKTAANAASKAKWWAGIKGAGGVLIKRMPLIGGTLFALSEVPNIFKATKENGVVAGITETVKAGIRLTGWTGGAAVGAALGSIVPGVGTLIGGLVGGFLGGALGDLDAGKSYTEQQKKLQEDALTKSVPQGLDTGSTNPFAGGVPQDQQLQLLREMVANDPRFRTGDLPV